MVNNIYVRESGGKSIYRLIFYHSLCWALYICYEISFLIIFSESNTSITGYIYYYVCNIALFYWHFNTLSRGLLPKTQPRYVFLFISVFGEMIVILAFKGAWDYITLSKIVPAEKLSTKLKLFIGLDFYRSVYYLFISSVIWSAINLGRFRKRTTDALLKQAFAEKANTDLKYQFAQAQNAFLKQQINPHLLFNTLNAIYSTVYLNSPKDSEAVLLLSDIMRYSYEEPDEHGLVALESEIFQVKNLIKLNTYRFRDTVQLDFNLKGTPKNYRIIPLVLLTLTENMFKHGDLQQKPRTLDIAIDESGQLSYNSNNVRKLRGQAEPGSNVGLNNTKLRLDYAYPDNYKLDITQTDELFTLALNINLAYERSNH